jgi:hypothetical protein
MKNIKHSNVDEMHQLVDDDDDGAITTLLKSCCQSIK